MQRNGLSAAAMASRDADFEFARTVSHDAVLGLREKLDAAAEEARGTLTSLSVGALRLQLVAPGYARLARWRARHGLRKLLAGRGLRTLLPLLLGLSATVACGFIEGGPGGVSGIAPIELSKSKRAAETPEKEKTRWSYVLPVDHGVRVDDEGEGQFRAPRFHGEHNGIDLLAPVGTPTFAACDGYAFASLSSSFGKWVHVVCPVPENLSDKSGPTPWASIFYAHLDTLELPLDTWSPVTHAQSVGTVGKTGNARGAQVKPHLHLELIIQKNKRAAMDELHLGRDQSGVPAASYFAEALEKSCLGPLGFQPKSGLVSRARRMDPFVVLTCLSQAKPNFKKPPVPLDLASNAWSEFYVAKDFNVNLGPDDALARR